MKNTGCNVGEKTVVCFVINNYCKYILTVIAVTREEKLINIWSSKN